MKKARNIRHSTLKKRAEIIDDVVDRYKKIRRRRNFPKKLVGQLIRLFFPGGAFIGSGAFKDAYAIHSRAHKLVLKISNAKSTNRDARVYNRLPINIRNKYFAKIYWRTKYCALQKYGLKSAAPLAEVKRLKDIGRKYGLIDIRPDNIRKVGGMFKIIDAHPAKKKATRQK